MAWVGGGHVLTQGVVRVRPPLERVDVRAGLCRKGPRRPYVRSVSGADGPRSALRNCTGHLDRVGNAGCGDGGPTTNRASSADNGTHPAREGQREVAGR